MSSAQTERLNREAAGKQARIEQLESALRALIPWAERAFDGLEYEEEDEREALWESLAGEPDNITPLQRARTILSSERDAEGLAHLEGTRMKWLPKEESEVQRQWREAREEIADPFRKRPSERKDSE